MNSSQSWTSRGCRRCASQWRIAQRVIVSILSLATHMYCLESSTKRRERRNKKRFVGNCRFREREILLNRGIGIGNVVMFVLWHYC